jgi:[ribosomal protein S5]-alanine N-acetyltransferase
VALAYPDPPLSDGTIRLRRWERGDLDCIRDAAGDLRIVQITSVPAVFTFEAGHAYIERQWQRAQTRNGVSLAIADHRSDDAIGYAGLTTREQPGVVGIGYWVVPHARGRGLATRAVRLLADWALQHGAARVEAWVEPRNVASQRVLTAAGFTREGVLRSFLVIANRRADAVVFSRIAR